LESRKIKRISRSLATIEGAGVHLKRAFGYNEVPLFDPFLLLDDFRNDDPAKYIPGFPWHPHRGIETITYILEGSVEHGDSLGNKGFLRAGDAQWMTAGSGIIHQEMPIGTDDGKMQGFQLWANLPASHKMMPPRYQDIKSDAIPEAVLENGIKIRVLCGLVNGYHGPVNDIIIDPEYLDISIPANVQFEHPVKQGYTAFAYVIEGQGSFSDGADQLLGNGTVVLFDDGTQVKVTTAKEPVRFLFISGKPLHEPIAWGGPIVMNTQEELRKAFEEYRNNTFIKK
jgi:redox-sensitive bicupin YhaK (pirin superfamily)